MADPFAIIGLTASIITFVDFSINLVSAGKSLYASPLDTTEELHRLGLIVQDVQRKNSQLWQIQETRTRNLCEDEMMAMKLAKESDKIAEDLMKVLKKLEIRDGHNRSVESMRVTIWQRLKKKEVVELQDRLLKLDSRVMNNMKLAFQGQQHSAFMTALEALDRSKSELAINFSARLDDIQGDIRRLIEMSTDHDTQTAQRTSLMTKLENFEKEQSKRQRQVEVIKSLHFAVLHRRWFLIEDADPFTNSWLFDESQTSFLDWLEKGDGIFWIGGKPGSGKSTLIKFASKHDKTKAALKRWAGEIELHTASYFFWNQGFEMQKSKTGLLQSLLYQVLSRAPELIPRICYDHPAHEPWEFNTLKTAFQSTTERDDIPAKFCFFIDGLDEYGGDEEDLSQVLSFLSRGSHVKFCVSSRQRPYLEDKFQRSEYSLAIQNFTRGDMITHVRQRLRQNEKFRALENADALLTEIVSIIAENAQGVWLWVHLVTRDLVKAVNHDEASKKLKEIIEEFPKDLEGYFEAVINRIQPPYKREMAQIFLITLEEVQPLPLYAFSLLERENHDPRYAIKAPISPISEVELSNIETPWKSRILNRCGDLLLVNPGNHPIFLRNAVDFMHRTVRDFLQDCYLQKLQSELKGRKYSPLQSLCNMNLFLLKKLPETDLSNPKLRKASIHRTIGLVDELLYYAHEQERTEESSELVEILDEVDRVNCVHAGTLRNHWTQARDSPAALGLDEYREGGNCNFLALTVQARLVGYVREKLKSDPRRLQKRGRPLLDYALRPRRVTAIRMPYHSDRDDPSVDENMVRLLLDCGANPNQQVHLNDGRTVWALFLLSMWETINYGEGSPSLTRAWYAACELLVQHGADFDCWLESHPSARQLTATSILEKVFGEEKAAKLTDQMRDVQAKNLRGSWFTGFWPRRLF
ncbi:hypothetical protein Hte_006311 [Hypoxylon texense]